MGEAVQLLLSLGAVALLVALVRWLRLGNASLFPDHEAVRRAAREAVHGFDAVDAVIGQDGATALALDRDGRTMVLKVHGAHVAARIVDARRVHAVRDGDALVIDTGDRRFGTVRLTIPDPDGWKNRINAV